MMNPNNRPPPANASDQAPSPETSSGQRDREEKPENSPNRSCDAKRKSIRHPPLSQNLLKSNPKPDRHVTSQLHPLARVASVLWVVFLIGGFYIATTLEPNPEGLGTHQQLGLPPCSMRVLLGGPCPSCGMTTSFAHFVRGQFVKSAQANPAGLLLAIVCAVNIPWAGVMAITGKYRSGYPISELFLWTVGPITVVALVQWIVRLCW